MDTMTLSTQLTEALTESKDIVINDLDIESGQEPRDDLDPEFIVPIEADITVSGATLSKLIRRQRRVLGKALKVYKPKHAINLIAGGGPVSDMVLRLARPKIKYIVNQMADEFRRGARITGIDWGDINPYWSAKIDPDRESIRFNVFFDVLGKWV